jgi:16S rRNA (uracil1498-N3)-methyltransferase
MGRVGGVMAYDSDSLSLLREGDMKSMTRRRFYAPPSAWAPDQKSLTLSATETRHAREALRLKSGDEIYVFDGAGREFQCAVQTISRNASEVSVISEVAPARSESPLHLTLAIALLKGEKFDLVIQKATELGVKRIVPLNSERADFRLRDHQDANARVTRWQRIAREAAKQSGRAYVPEVTAPMAFNSLVNKSTEAEKKSSDTLARLMFSERGGQALSKATGDFEGQSKIAAIVGPEGGWADQELDLARAGDWQIVTLSGRILRAETAAIVVVGLLQHRFGDLV